jgi:hypothetical protein
MNTLSRRTFLKNSFLTAAVLVFAKGKLFASVTPIETIAILQEDLFPLIKTLQSNSAMYILKILNHSKISNQNKQFLRNGVKWLNEEAIRSYNNTYSKLSSQERQTLLLVVAQVKWGESFIYTLLSYIMESVLGDSIYDINKDQKGWAWLEYETGYPRPKKAFL